MADTPQVAAAKVVQADLNQLGTDLVSFARMLIPVTTPVPPIITSSNQGYISAFAQPLTSQPVASDSATVVTNFVNSISASGYSFGINCGTSGLRFVIAASTTPAVTLHAQGSHGDFTSNTGTTIPIPTTTPAVADPNLSSDDPLIVYQPYTDTLWELWQAVLNPDGSWTATWGGKLANASKSSGVFQAPYGLSGSGIAYLGLMVNDAEVSAGAINHAVCCCFPSLTAPQVPPANRTDASTHAGQPAEGAWLRFPSSLAMPTGLQPLAQMIFKAIQTYGLVIVDIGGAAMIQAQYSATNDAIFSAMGGQAEYSVIANLPWSQLELLSPPKNWPSWT